MTMFQMLPKMIRAKEFLGLITFSKFVHMIEMFGASIPVGRITEFLTAVTTGISCG